MWRLRRLHVVVVVVHLLLLLLFRVVQVKRLRSIQAPIIAVTETVRIIAVLLEAIIVELKVVFARDGVVDMRL